MNIKKYLIIFIIAIFISQGHISFAQNTYECILPQFGAISVDPDIEVNGAGQNVDSIEFWKSPDSSQTLMFVTAKGNQLVEVWKYPFTGNEQTPLTHSTFNNSQVNGIVVDQQTDLLYIAVGEPSSTVSVFSLPDLSFQTNFNQPGKNYHSEPNLALLNLSNGDKNIYVSADFTVDIHDAVTGNFIDEFTPQQGLETMAADSFYQRLYIPDENDRTGIYVYNPDGTPHNQNGTNIFGGGGIFNADAEGIIVYNCPLSNPEDNGEGFIVVSDQRSSLTDFEFFDRITWEHLGKLNISGVSNTDGIASFPYPLPDYPLGVFAVLNDDHSVVIVGWEKIFNEIFSSTGIEKKSEHPTNFELKQNYPNPFNPTTKIKFTIPNLERFAESLNFTNEPISNSVYTVTLTVYDILGNEVAMLINERLSAGEYEVEFSSEDLSNQTRTISSGIYFYTLKTNNFIGTKKMLLLK